jgi:antitoxin (DNA-binding transcriptional repressor) of toxin-antitoxin stability system
MQARADDEPLLDLYRADRPPQSQKRTARKQIAEHQNRRDFGQNKCPPILISDRVCGQECPRSGLFARAPCPSSRTLDQIRQYVYVGYIKKTNISYLKQQLSRCIREVREGEEYVVLDRNTPVAVLRPYTSLAQDPEMDGLVAEGLIRPATEPYMPELPKPIQVQGAALSKLIHEERDGR